MKYFLMKLLCCFFLAGLLEVVCSAGGGLKWVRVNVPQYRVPGEVALLQCDYDLGNDTLYSVKWYKEHEEFYRYVPKSRPQSNWYKVEGVHVNINKSDSRKVVLHSVNWKTSGSYKCEVSAEAPSFASAESEAKMEVVYNKISFENLLDLSDSMIQELIPVVGTRIKFLKHLDEFKKTSQFDIINLPVAIDDEGRSDIFETSTSESTNSMATELITYSNSGSSLSNAVNEKQGSDLSEASSVIVSTVNRSISFCGLENLFKDELDRQLPQFDLKTLLTVSPHGGRILHHYQQNGHLTDSLRNKLVEVIMTHLYPYIMKYRLTHCQYNTLSAKIIHLFPNEANEIYYQSGKRISNIALQAKGKLVYKAHNILYLSPDKTYMRKRKVLTDAEDNIKRYREDTEDEINALTWLKHNREPWNEVIKYWRLTFDMRTKGNFNKVADFVSTWPILSDPRADSLIEADFKQMYHGKSLGLLSKWNTFFEKLVDLKRNEINKSRDPLLVNLMSILEGNSGSLSEALPYEDPVISGVEEQYQIGDEINLNCTSGKSRPASILHWYINEQQIQKPEALIQYPNEQDTKGLVMTTLGLRFILSNRHFLGGSMRVKCVASIAPVLLSEDREAVVQSLPVMKDLREALLLVKSSSGRSKEELTFHILALSVITFLVT